ncbi:hypothetical protein NQ314_010874 [Rhamnusium bicolor]|uniref:Uncharacterized protein n=1 Tax=Rhamnusium bicolor TaxID=1586634 RepID=A0AAV8XN72_9CUCU|nr:hypothetical protein NQ314_010874 [Rhamnusium bicolor]
MAILVSNAEDISTYGIPDTINDLIETLREGIPDVIEISSVNVQLPENDYLTGYLNVNDGKITGIKEFNLSLTYNVISFPTGFALKLDPINVNLEYLTDLALFNIPLLSIFGEGTGR